MSAWAAQGNIIAIYKITWIKNKFILFLCSNISTETSYRLPPLPSNYNYDSIQFFNNSYQNGIFVEICNNVIYNYILDG